MKVRHLIINIADSLDNPTVDDVWRHLIAYLSVAGQKVDVTKKDIKEVLNGRDIPQGKISR